MNEIKLTEYSHGAGCGCKISPMMLDEILKCSTPQPFYESLLVGNEDKDDAAAYDLGDGTSVLSTADFFMPIVDDPFKFGRIAATNALSDIYAMGGKPLMAIAIFGWPIDKLSTAVGKEVIEGGRAACLEAGIALAGGHSIDSPEPIFGLSVTGIVENKNLMRNSGADDDCVIYLTKPIGIGILTTAQKQKKITAEELEVAIDAMTTLNKVGEVLAKLDGVLTMTDVTGFGLLGHLSEVCEASGISAEVSFSAVPLLANTQKYRELGCIAGGSKKNFASYGSKISELSDEQREILCDPQTSGGLLIFAKKSASDKVEAVLGGVKPIGFTKKQGEFLIEVVS